MFNIERHHNILILTRKMRL